MYLHVPAAWLAYLAFTVTAIASVLWLVPRTRSATWDLLAGASAEELADTYYVALLHGSGCTSNSHEATQLFGEDIMHRAAFFLIDPADSKIFAAFVAAAGG